MSLVSRGNTFARVLFVFVVCYVLFTNALCVSAIAVPVAAPTIKPSSNTFVGEVTVTIIPNQRYTLTYFTVNGLKPSNRDDVFLKGTEITLGEPGHYIVQAVTYSKINVEMFAPSKVVSVEYNVTPTTLPRPVADPSSDNYGRYFRGTVLLNLLQNPSLLSDEEMLRNLEILYLVSYLPTLSTDGTSGALPPPASNGSWSVFNGTKLKLKKPGTYILRVQSHEKLSLLPLVSPMSRLVYRVRPRLVYDVSTECCKNSRQPVVGHSFTIWLSHAVNPLSIFLSTSAKGCELNRHILDDTVVLSVGQRQRAFQFVTCMEDQPRVFVCLKEQGDSGYRTVPRRDSFKKDSNAYAFSIIASRDRSNSRAENCSVPRNDVSLMNSKPKVENNGGLWLFLLFSGCCAWFLGMTIYIRIFLMKIPKPVNKRRGHTRHDSEELIELQPKGNGPLDHS